jgi:hypothetical protein
MSITGKIKFFEVNYALDSNDATISAADLNASAQYAIDRNAYTYFRSNGSNDATNEVLTIAFDGSKSINRLFLLDHNLKEYNIKYLNSVGSMTNFTNAVGITSSPGSVSETVYAKDTSYYEVDTVTTTTIQITATKTQVANEEKYISRIVATSELGTLNGFPRVDNLDIDRQLKVKKTLNGRVIVQKGIEIFGFSISFKDYPRIAPYSDDLDLMMDLHEREEPFLVWLCGGKYGTPYFGYTLRGYRLQDLLQMAVTKKIDLEYRSDIYNNPPSMKIVFEESI